MRPSARRSRRSSERCASPQSCVCRPVRGPTREVRGHRVCGASVEHEGRDGRVRDRGGGLGTSSDTHISEPAPSSSSTRIGAVRREPPSGVGTPARPPWAALPQASPFSNGEMLHATRGRLAGGEGGSSRAPPWPLSAGSSFHLRRWTLVLVDAHLRSLHRGPPAGISPGNGDCGPGSTCNGRAAHGTLPASLTAGDPARDREQAPQAVARGTLGRGRHRSLLPGHLVRERDDDRADERDREADHGEDDVPTPTCEPLRVGGRRCRAGRLRRRDSRPRPSRPTVPGEPVPSDTCWEDGGEPIPASASA